MDGHQLEIANILEGLHTMKRQETDEERLQYLEDMETLAEQYLSTFETDYQLER